MKKQIAACSNSMVTITSRQEISIEVEPDHPIYTYDFPSLYMDVLCEIREMLNVPYYLSIVDIVEEYIFIVPAGIKHGYGEVAWATIGGFHFGILDT